MNALALLAHAYQLSPRQAELAQALAATGALRQAAARAGLPYPAARNTLAELKAKFGIAGAPMLIGHLCAVLADPDPARRPRHDLFDLSPRQFRIARLLGVSRDRAEIAARLGVSKAVIDGELKQIYLALGVNGAGEVVRLIDRASAGERDEDWAHALPDARLERPHGRVVSYSDYGPTDGRPVLILHSTICTRAPPTRLVEVLQGRGFRPLAIDRPGFGQTSPVRDRPGYAEAADDAAAVAARLGIARLHVIARGSSHAAVVLAQRRPELVGRVVLVNPTPDVHHSPVDAGPLGAAKRRFARFPWLIEVSMRAAAGVVTPSRLRATMLRSFRHSPPDLALVRNDPRFLADYLRAVRSFARGELAGYVAEQVAWAEGFDVAPTPGKTDWRILQARHFVYHHPEPAVAYWRERAPDTPVRWVEDAGQLLAYSHPETVADALVD